MRGGWGCLNGEGGRDEFQEDRILLRKSDDIDNFKKHLH